jgi:UDP-N-acetylglucosamine--N-acetylmuramyl-(pentapeptide) pyrophosphoryl-undecaprenol N-acetylglucosamine transferase
MSTPAAYEPPRPRGGVEVPSVPRERILFVASAGGHIAELRRLAERIPSADESLWVSFDGDQARSVLADVPSLSVAYIAPRDGLAVLLAVRSFLPLLRGGQYDRVISTGAAVAVSAFIAARLARVPATYIESVARVDGPSLTGRIVQTLRLAELRMQHPNWNRRGWHPWPNVLAQYPRLPEIGPAPAGGLYKVFVTIGTIHPYRFDSVVDAVLRSGLANEHTVWQLGCTTRDDLPGTVLEQMTFEEFQKQAQLADVVVTHAGVGSLFALLDLGIHPVVVPRRRRRNEHVDDHQEQIAEHLRDLGVAHVVEAPGLVAEDLLVAVARRPRMAP